MEDQVELHCRLERGGLEAAGARTGRTANLEGVCTVGTKDGIFIFER